MSPGGCATSELTGGVNGSRRAPRVNGESGVGSIGGGDLSSRALDGDVVAAGGGESQLESTRAERGGTHREMSDLTWPAMRRFHASLHSWMISVAYLRFLASPENANWFSGFPSGICARRNRASQLPFAPAGATIL